MLLKRSFWYNGKDLLSPLCKINKSYHCVAATLLNHAMLLTHYEPGCAAGNKPVDGLNLT